MTSFHNRVVYAFAAGACVFALFASDASAQRRHWPDRYDRFSRPGNERTITLQVGAFNHDFYGDESRPMGALRLNWGLRRWVLSELGAFYTQLENPGEDNVHMTGVDIGLQAQLPHSFFRPYVGLATGINYTDEGDGGDSFFAPSMQAMGGIRLWLSRNVAIRGEARFRLDEQQSTPNAADNSELTGGLTIRW
ncbi:MAG TPA: hypothetical protein VF042_01870 [Gemmatimonadaceae bacterium]